MQKKLLSTGVFLLFFLIIRIEYTYSMERFDIITTLQLVDLIKERQNGNLDFHLVNTLDELIYRTKSIPGSISIPWSTAGELAESRLGKNHETLIITYCMGYR